MELYDLKLEPGFFTEQTARGAVNRYKFGDKVRFRNRMPEKLGGWVSVRWVNASGDTITPKGVVRSAHEWRSLDNAAWIAVATQWKVYVLTNLANNTLTAYDVTPLKPGSAGSGTLTNPFGTLAGSDIVTVTHVGHGEQVDGFVHFQLSTTVGGLSLAGEFQVVEVIDPDTYTIRAAGPASATTTGGGTVAWEYEIDPVPMAGSSLSGYGIGGYGQGGYGQPRESDVVVISQLRLWSLDNWGEDLILSPRSGSVYTWDKSAGPTTRAALINNAPPTACRVLVSSNDRHLLVLGGYDYDNNRADPALIQWCNQADYNDWTPSTTNSAGDKRIDGGGSIITGLRTRSETLVWTEDGLYGLQFVGGNDVFAARAIGESVSIASPKAMGEANGVVYFMSLNDFFVYNGQLMPLSCDVRQFVFNNLNRNKMEQVVCSVNRMFNEVWWFYPSSASSENDRYVIFNYVDSCWYFGALDRSSFKDYGPTFSAPFAFSSGGTMYVHERGVDSDGQPLVTQLDSYDIEIDEGNEMIHISRLIPDFVSLNASVDYYVSAKKYPQDIEVATGGPFTVTASTPYVDFRARGRQVSLSMRGATLGQWWRLGTWRAGGRPHGKR